MKFIPIHELSTDDDMGSLAPVLNREGIPYGVLEYRTLNHQAQKALGDAFGMLLVPASFEEQANALLHSHRSLRNSTFVRVHSLSDRFAADVIAGALDTEGIAYQIERHDDTLEPAFAAQHGYGDVLVPAEDVARAKATIREVLSVPPSNGGSSNGG